MATPLGADRANSGIYCLRPRHLLYPQKNTTNMAKNKIDGKGKDSDTLSISDMKNNGETPPPPADLKPGTGDGKTPPAKSDANKKKPSKNELKAASYAKLYPECPAFHITSDGQVFLDKNKNEALSHQQTIAPTESVEIIKIK